MKRNNIYKYISKKMHSKLGESIAETLVALLISALALTMFAGAITSSSNMITKSRKKIKNYYDNNDSLIVGSSGTSVTGGIKIEDKTSSDPLNEQSYNILYLENDEFEKTPVVAYKYKK